MDLFVCPRDWTFATDRFTPDHLVSLQDPGADVSSLRPPWILPENHHVAYFYDVDLPGHDEAPPLDAVAVLLQWLGPRCGPSSRSRFLIHCDAGLGRSPAVAYVAWSIHLGAGREPEAFAAMQRSCLNLRILPNSVIVAHADRILERDGALSRPLSEWNRTVRWSRARR